VSTTPSSNSRFLLRTLGSARLERVGAAGEREELLGPGKPFALLVYLALSPRRTASRDSLVDLLWANAEPERARQTLRQALTQLRHLLGENGLTGGAREVSLSDIVRTDLDDFFAAMRAGDHAGAVKLYAGPFLADFAVAGGEAFDEWAEQQRDRVQGAHAFALDAIVRACLEAGRAREAVPLARSLRDADPFKQSAWRLLMEALLSAGNALDARLEADAFERFLAAEGCDAEPAARDAMLRARNMEASAPHGGEQLVADLIGREAEFAALVAAWARASAGRSQLVEVLAPAGLGKTRLLEDLHRRLRARGSHALFVRAVWGERTLPFALAAALAGAMAPLRGAAGISPSAARTLVGLDPALASLFRAQPDVPESSATGVRTVASALLELLRAVSEERPLALLMDDLHWADQLSLAALGAMRDRMDAEKVLLVAARRPPRTSAFAEPGPVRVELAPLSRAQIGDLVLSMAAAGSVRWEDGLLEALDESTGGSPLLILETLRYARESGLLIMENGEWGHGEVSRLRAELGGGSAIARRVRREGPAGRRVLLLAAAAGEPISDATMMAAHGAPEEDVRAATDELERAGLMVRSGYQLRMSHDHLSEVVLECSSAHEIRDAHRALGVALAAAPGHTPASLQKAARHLVEGACDDELAGLFLEWRRVCRSLGDRRPDRRLAAALLGDLATDGRVRIALSRRPLVARAVGDGRALAAAAAAAVAVIVAIGWAIVAPRPSRLALAVTPLSASDALGLVPVPVVEIRDQFGRAMSDAADTVRLASTSPRVTLRGDTAVAATGGRAAFGNVFVDNASSAPVTLRFTSSRLAPLDLTLDGSARPALNLRLEHALMNGHELGNAVRAFSVLPGDSITGSVVLRYSTTWAAASVLLTVVPTWGDRRTNFVNLGPLVTPARDLMREAHVKFKAPTKPGCYRLIFAFQAEDDVKYVASGTNWTMGAPIWDDGNDVMDWSASDLRQADSVGVVYSTIVRVTAGRTTRRPSIVPATTIVVQVRGANGRAPTACGD